MQCANNIAAMTTTITILRVHENSSISTRIIIKLMLGKWVTNRWARFGYLAYCQYTLMLYSSLFILTIYSACALWVSALLLLVAGNIFLLILPLSFSFSLNIRCFRLPFFLYIRSLFSLHFHFFRLHNFIIQLFAVGTLALQPLIPMVLLMPYMLLFCCALFRLVVLCETGNERARAKKKIRQNKRKYRKKRTYTHIRSRRDEQKETRKKERKKKEQTTHTQKDCVHLPNENSLHIFCNWYYVVARGRDTGRSMASCPKRIVRPSRYLSIHYARLRSIAVYFVHCATCRARLKRFVCWNNPRHWVLS